MENRLILSMDMIAAIFWNCKVIGNYLCSSPLGVESDTQNNHKWPSHRMRRWQAARNPCPPTSSTPMGGGGQAPLVTFKWDSIDIQNLTKPLRLAHHPYQP